METQERGTEPSAIQGDQFNPFSLSLSKQTLVQDKKIDNSSVSPIGQRKRSYTHSRVHDAGEGVGRRKEERGYRNDGCLMSGRSAS